MKLCESINEELGKSKIKSVAKEFISNVKGKKDDGFEIEDIDGRVIVDSDGDIDSDDTSVESVGPFDDFKDYLDDIAEEELSEANVLAVIKELKGMEIERSKEVTAWKVGPHEYEEAGEVENDYSITLVDFSWDKKSDTLEVKKVK